MTPLADSKPPELDPNEDRERGHVIVSYLTLRRVIGVLGCALPIVVAVWGLALPQPDGLLDSISSYYDYRTRDAFVGILFAIAWFLFTYRGYDRRDRLAGKTAWACALIVAFIPCNGSDTESGVHYVGAAGLLLTLAYFSIALFTLTSGDVTPDKIKRNRVYRWCGVVMLLCIALVPLSHVVLSQRTFDGAHPVFWLELIALEAFGFSWFVKGETILRDKVR